MLTRIKALSKQIVKTEIKILTGRRVIKVAVRIRMFTVHVSC